MSDTAVTVPAPAPAPAPSSSTALVVAAAPGLPATADTRANPFAAVALLLKSVRTSLESSKRPPEQAPRWVRIVRVRQFADPKTGDADVIAKGVMKAMDVVTLAVSFLQRFTLDATDLLVQGDAAKALVEVSADLVKAVASKDFINALELAVGQEPSASSPIGGVADIVDKIVAIADKVPEPGDLKLIGTELYGLLAVEQLTEGVPAENTAHVDIAKTGKLRLLHWGFWQGWKVQNLGKGKEPIVVFVLGARRIDGAVAGKLAAHASGDFGDPDNTETVYDLDFTGDNAGKDIAEANAILDALGYGAKYPVADAKALAEDFATRLRAFQKINDIPVTGRLDNPTIARLMHLDYDHKNLKRAKPFRENLLPAGFDPSKPSVLPPSPAA